MTPPERQHGRRDNDAERRDGEKGAAPSHAFGEQQERCRRRRGACEAREDRIE
jgi:hypothetical protein